jgi:hypothetical protein
MGFRPLLYIVIALVFYYASGAVELRGDMAPVAAEGVSTERATYHIIALLLLLGALGCFVAALVSAVRAMRRS